MIGHINIHYIANKISEITRLLQYHGKINLLGITETHLNDKNHDDNILSIPNYTFVRKDTNQPGHTGIGAYIHNDALPFIKRRADLETKDIESLWFEIQNLKSKSQLVGFFYRHPDSRNNWFEDFDDMLENVNSLDLDMLLLGDFNLNLLEKEAKTSYIKSWLGLIDSYGLTQMITKPTRVEKRNTKITSTLIDHIYTNNVQIIRNSFVSNIALSDHKPIICSMSAKIPKTPNNSHKYATYRSFKTFSPINFLSDLSKIDFSSVFQTSDVNEATIQFIKLFTACIDKHAPLKTRRVRHCTMPAWLNQDIQSEMRKRDDLKKRLGKKHTEYKKQRNKVTELQRKAKQDYFIKLVTNTNSYISTIWNALNEFTNKSKKTRNSSFPGTPNEFNDYFLSLVDKIIQDDCDDNKSYQIPTYLNTYCQNKLKSDSPFQLPLLTAQGLVNIVKKLKNKKSLDIYNLNSYFIKISISYICNPLLYIYNTSIINGIFPDCLKTAKVIPIPKTRTPDSFDNFRPISILPALSKPLERHIHLHLSEYLENHNLLYQYQSGFRQHHSCHTSLIHLCDNWLKAINDRKIVGAVFLDLRKAFDLVTHNILMEN